MPYIKQSQRTPIDKHIAPLLEHLKSVPVEEQDGALNYAVTKILHEVYPVKYFHINRVLGVLSAIAREYYRRVVAPYEDRKIDENGDVG